MNEQAEENPIILIDVSLLLAAGFTVEGRITPVQFDALMRELSRLPADRSGYIRVDNFHLIHEGYLFGTAVPYNHILAVRYTKEKK